jgi:alpha-L-fucosidase
LGKKAEDYDAVNLNRLARDLQPHILINNRNGLPEDFDTPEQRVGKYQDDRPWESCITICRQWSWKPNDDMKSLKECVQTLIMAAAGDGNLLLNVGPMPDGRIEQRQIDRLKEMGAWLARNGRTIYGTRGGPWKPNKSFASTRRGNLVFLHILRPDVSLVQLPALPVAIKSAVTMDGRAVKFSQQADKVVLSTDSVPLDPIDTIVCLELEGSAMAIPAIAQEEEIKATSSNPFTKHDARNDPSFAFDNEPRSRWSPENGATSGWIAADLGRERTIHRVRIEEAGDERVTGFEFQYKTGEGWKTLFKGTTLGRWFQREFAPVTAREFRLQIISATASPVIADIEFYDK